MNIRHLLLDLDGTLVHGDGIPMRIDFVRRMIHNWKSYGGALKSLQAFQRIQASVESPPSHMTNAEKMVSAFAESFQISQDQAREVLTQSVCQTFPHLKKHFFPVPGATSFVHWAKSKFPLILATNPVWLPEIVELRVNWANLKLSDFVSFTDANRMHSCKPRIEYYQELIQQERLDPSQCLMIGNDRKNDLPATQLGIPVYLLSSDAGSPREDYRSIRVKSGSVQAWLGTFSGLRSLLKRAG
jgi:FMN phosphatase YigB (HAD superfamily)